MPEILVFSSPRIIKQICIHPYTFHGVHAIPNFLRSVEPVPVLGSFAVQFWNHLRYGHHLRAGIIFGPVQIDCNEWSLVTLAFENNLCHFILPFNGIICDPILGSFAVQDHLRSFLGIIAVRFNLPSRGYLWSCTVQEKEHSGGTNPTLAREVMENNLSCEKYYMVLITIRSWNEIGSAKN